VTNKKINSGIHCIEIDDMSRSYSENKIFNPLNSEIKIIE